MKDGYCAMILDVKGSRSFGEEERKRLQLFLDESVELLNGLYRPGIVHEVTFSAGDELQGLFYRPLTAILYGRLLALLLHPAEIRIGLGLGEWSVRMDGGTSRQDGPAYHNARHALTMAHSRKTQSVRLASGQESDDLWASYLLNAADRQKQTQSVLQSRVFLATELMYPFTEPLGSTMKKLTNTFLPQLWRLKAEKYPLPSSIGAAGLAVIEPIPITGTPSEAEDTVQKHGLGAMLAELFQTTPQNIGTTLRRSNMTAIRAMDYMALQYIQKVYGDGHD